MKEWKNRFEKAWERWPYQAIAVSRGYLAPNRIDICFIPTFSENGIDGTKRTAVKLMIKLG